MWWDCVMAGLWPRCRNVTHRSQHRAAISWSLAAMTFGALDQCLGRELRPVIFHSLICCSGVWHQTTSNIFMLSLQVCCMLAATLATLCIVSISAICFLVCVETELVEWCIKAHTAAILHCHHQIVSVHTSHWLLLWLGNSSTIVSRIMYRWTCKVWH